MITPFAFFKRSLTLWNALVWISVYLLVCVLPDYSAAEKSSSGNPVIGFKLRSACNCAVRRSDQAELVDTNFSAVQWIQTEYYGICDCLVLLCSTACSGFLDWVSPCAKCMSLWRLHVRLAALVRSEFALQITRSSSFVVVVVDCYCWFKRSHNAYCKI